MSSLAALRQQLAEVLAPVRPASDGLSTGVAALDAVLAGGGLPRGRLTELVGARGSGKTTLVRRAVAAAAGRGVWVAYVDASRTLWARDWAGIADAAALADGRLCVVRPAEAARGAWCADVLLRSGAFGLVVLDGAPALSRQVAVRLTRLARDADAALVVLGEDERTSSALGGALRLRVECRRPAGRRGQDEWGARRVAVRVEKGGNQQTVEVGCAIGVARRLCTHSEVPDRRGVAARAGRSAGGRGGADAGGAAGASAVASPPPSRARAGRRRG